MKVQIIWLHNFLESIQGNALLGPLERLAEMGCEVNLICKGSVNAEKIVGSLKIRAIKAGRIPFFSWIALLIRCTKTSKLTRERYDVVMLDYGTLPIGILLSVLHWLGLSHKPKVVLSIQSRPVITKGVRGMLYEWYFAMILKISKYVADAISAVTTPESMELAKQARINTEKFFVYPSAVDERIFDALHAGDMAKQEIRNGLKISQCFVLLYHGSIALERGIMNMILAVKKAYDDGLTNIVLVLLGSGVDVQQISNYVTANKLDRVVILLPPVPYNEVPNYIMASDMGLMALPDHIWWRNQLPFKMIECLSLGVPVICTDLPGHKWVARDVEDAVVFMQETVESIAEAIVHAYHNRVGLKANAAKASLVILQRFSTVEIARKLKEVFEALHSY